MLRTEELVEGRCGGRENRYNARRKTVKKFQKSVAFHVLKKAISNMTVCVDVCYRPLHDVISAFVGTERYGNLSHM